ncbi:hypothetical protein IWW39_006169, partial [Coemansia spiralis]
MDELTDYYYEHHTRQSTMGIVDHRFSLHNTLNVPTPWQYLSMVSYWAKELHATNATLQYLGSDDTVFTLSFSRNDLEAHSVDELLDMLKKGSSEWIKELYTGSDYIQNAVKTFSLAMGRFTITVSHIQGGYGKMIPDYYEVLGLENNDDDYEVRKLLLKEGKLGLDCVPLLEEMFQVHIDVLRDYRHLQFDTRRTIGKGLERELKKKYLPDAENLTQYDGSDDEDEDKDNVYYYFFDYETVFDPTTMEILPYAYAIVKCDHKFKILDTQCRIGLGCDTHLSNYLFTESPVEDETKYLIGYNNSRFDNFILLKHSLQHNDYVGHARFAGNTIVSAKINNFVVRDLCRMLNMSLDSACKAFKIELPKLTGAVKHHEVQMKFMEDKAELTEYLLQMNETIKRYVVRDCESLSQLYKLTKKTMNRLINLNVEDHYTLAGMTYAAFKNITGKTGQQDQVQLPVLSKYYERHDRFVREAIIGGRSQMLL